MPEYSDYRGCRVFLHDEDSKMTIAETVVREFDRMTQTIMIDENCLRGKTNGRVSVLIVCADRVIESKGTLRRSGKMGLLGVALYKEKTKESRGAARYTVNVPAVVGHLAVGGKLVALNKPVDVTVVNISTGGILIRSSARCFNVGTAFLIGMDFAGDHPVNLLARVVRIKKIDAQTMEYGCSFL